MIPSTSLHDTFDDDDVILNKYDTIQVTPHAPDTRSANNGAVNQSTTHQSSSCLHHPSFPPQQPLHRDDRRLLLLLCLIACVLELKPSEPFLTNYLIDVKHLSETTVN